MDELLSCPFCGGNAEFIREDDPTEPEKWVFCATEGCGANVGGCFTAETWNRRAAPTAAPEGKRQCYNCDQLLPVEDFASPSTNQCKRCGRAEDAL